jgi:hypothetical protein
MKHTDITSAIAGLICWIIAIVVPLIGLVCWLIARANPLQYGVL